MLRNGPLVLWRPAISAIVLTATIAARAAAQSAPDCSTRDCASLNQIWAPAAQIHELKNQFVATVRQFAEALAGTYGDEGRRISSGIQSLDRAREQWDDAIVAYETMLSKVAESAEVHVALGTVYLDRNRVEDALRELAAAGRLDARRPDVYSLTALASGLAHRPEEAAQALLKAAALDSNPITFYNLAQQLIKSGRGEQARDALRMFEDSRRRTPGGSGATNGPASPFERVSLFRQAAGVAPIFPLQPYRQGFALLIAGNYEQAVAAFKRAAADDPLIAYSPGTVDAVVDAGAALRRAQLPLALSELEAAIVKAPDRSEAHRLLGVAYWADGQDDKSIAQLNAAIRLASHDERSRIALADVLIDTGRFAQAEQSLKETVQAIPDSGLAHYRLGQLHQTLTMLPQAVHEFETAAGLGPLVGMDRLYETIGGLYANQADFDRAADAYATRVDVNPNNADAHRKLGEIYFLQGRDVEALAEFVAALLVDPKSSDALAAACQAYARLGRYAEAVDSARQALALDARHREARYALATSLMRLGRTEEGKKELEIFQQVQAEAMANTQRQSELKIALRDAALSLGSGDYLAAASLLRKALAIDPDAGNVQRDLGIALMKLGEIEAAIQPLTRALQSDDGAELHQLLADAYRALGRTADSQTQAALVVRAAEHKKEERLRNPIGSR